MKGLMKTDISSLTHSLLPSPRSFLSIIIFTLTVIRFIVKVKVGSTAGFSYERRTTVWHQI